MSPPSVAVTGSDCHTVFSDPVLETDFSVSCTLTWLPVRVMPVTLIMFIIS